MKNTFKHLLLLTAVLLLSSIIPSVSSAQQTDTDTSSAPTCAIINNNLRYGTRDSGSGSDVSVLQDFLNTKGYLNSTPTGFFGHMTMNAVKAFQSAYGISPTGFVGPLTRAKIQAVDCLSGSTSNGSSAITPPATTVNTSTVLPTTVPPTTVNTITYPVQSLFGTTTKSASLFQSYPITLTSVFGNTGIVADSVMTTTNPPYNPYYKQPYKVPPFVSYAYPNATTTWPTDLCSIFPKQIIQSTLAADIVQFPAISSSTCSYGYANMTVSAFSVAFGYLSEHDDGSIAPWKIFSNVGPDSTTVVSSPIEGPGYELVILKDGKKVTPYLYFFTKYVYGFMWMGNNVLGTDQQKVDQLIKIAKQTIPNLPAAYRQ